MSENTEAMNMLEDLPESAQDGQQKVDEAAATTLQEEAAETTQEATGKRKQGFASLPPLCGGHAEHGRAGATGRRQGAAHRNRREQLAGNAAGCAL